ncbi:MFS transporter [Microlunatus spumicola]|uniref:MFS transporter n=1 Tax=Microlunatus spumicola TaxID=81499 RepID=A0ABP6XG71_9ACTN
MTFVAGLRRLWRHALFRRLLTVRVAIQGADGLLQVALASFVLFSPERQPDAASIAAVLAVTLLPFSVLGPFVSVTIDRYPRRQILLVGALGEAVLALALAAVVATGQRSGVAEVAVYGIVLLSISLTRYLLAALSASLPHTIDADEYLVANAVVPTIGPAGVLVGAGLGTVLRLVLGRSMPDYLANAILFVIVAAAFGVAALLALRIGRRALGPDATTHAVRAREVLHGLVEAVRHLRERREAGLGLLTIGAHRIVYGVVTVATILVYRNYFHTVEDVEPAIADLGILVAATAIGFVVAAAVAPPLSARFGIRRVVVGCLVGSAVFQLLPGAIYVRVPLLVAAFLLGLTAQVIKICVDTLVQAHVDDDVKGRAFVLYDMVFNVALVLAASIGALVLPADGRSVAVLAVLALCYLLTAAAFTALSRHLELDRGTESLRADVPAEG